MPEIRHAATAVGDVNPDIGILADSEFAQGTGCRAPGNAEGKGAAGKILNKIQPVIEFSDVAFSFSNRKTLFKDLSFNIDPGKFYLISGPSGSGKSPLLRLINRLGGAYQREYFFNSRRLSAFSPPVLRRSILYIQQTPTAMDNPV